MQKILVILGPTATGKSNLAVKLAKKYNGEIISADSRQVYKGLNIGTGKITKKEMLGIPHHMLDVISPKKVFSVSGWQKQTKKIIADIISRGKLPIICGGTGFYIQSIVESAVLPEVPPNKLLRKKLEKNGLEDLQKILAKLDVRRFSNIDIKNPIRLIRAIEIATYLGSVPKIKKQKNQYKFLQIGLILPNDELKEKIYNRLFSRIKRGMIKEAENLHKDGLSWKRMRELGLEYRYLAYYLKKRLSKLEFIKKLETEIWHYAKRQMTWFKKDKKIKWFKPNQIKEIEKLVTIFVDY
ncbi:MAG: tRNA (adenosine(37)-N6)-dimethylallyltransferase MiaA [Candidatus Zambryskibacteria bacterium]|nr:tRNA (adenosine(37)-N6)-dimethylallyltransferase MiaA [Candidatus Zambryskibacteria bacterium]